jgi:hypothetical protein
MSKNWHILPYSKFDNENSDCKISQWSQYMFISALTLEIQFSDGKDWDPINRFYNITFLCQWVEVIVHFVDIGGILGHQCLNFVFINHYSKTEIVTRLKLQETLGSTYSI